MNYVVKLVEKKKTWLIVVTKIKSKNFPHVACVYVQCSFSMFSIVKHGIIISEQLKKARFIFYFESTSSCLRHFLKRLKAGPFSLVFALLSQCLSPQRLDFDCFFFKKKQKQQTS